MIEFSGRVSDKVQREILRKQSRFLGYSGGVVTLIGATISIFFGIYFYSNLLSVLIPTLGFAVLTVISFSMQSSKRIARFKWNLTITIKDSMVELKVHGLSIKQANGILPISKITRVIDGGEWYYLKTRFDQYGFVTSARVCQKSLITKGTIEEFEKFFEGKIVRNK